MYIPVHLKPNRSATFGHCYTTKRPRYVTQEVLNSEPLPVLVSWFNIRSRRSEALSLLLLQNAVLEQVTGNGQYSIQAALQFLPGGASVSPANVFSWLSDVELKLSGATFVPVSLGLFTAAAAVFPSMDQAEGGRLLQRLAGVSGSLYWVSNMFWDYAVLYLLYMLLLSPMVVIWGLGDSFQFWMSVVLLFAAYGWAAIPFAYIMAGIGGSGRPGPSLWQSWPSVPWVSATNVRHVGPKTRPLAIYYTGMLLKLVLGKQRQNFVRRPGSLSP
ncbi:hypothetical protein HPB48_001430 [Haemaphysalis longicornis]|uniref:Uncharacterized protein n=1 Tax=Haemaphysalis longicornis TaxID=44386 RepID=A0A9J6GAL8_HAELO|nr:hypothetical protein HPB48_001430 [Haemaphysalis longicornis]